MEPDPSPLPHSPYIGRFAPSPTGALHFGSLVAAVGSYLEACKHSGLWQVRIEDIDPPREQPGAADSILYTLEAFGFKWEGGILYQHTRTDAYHAALEALRKRGLAYPCSCSRKEITAHGLSGKLGPIYPGQCRTQPTKQREQYAWRLRAPDQAITFIDQFQGEQTARLSDLTGDFVIKRADGFWAYHLAVVVDDAASGVTHIVRGADLLHASFPQIALYQALNLPLPNYGHLPVALDSQGQKLSKQTFAKPIQPEKGAYWLWLALAFLEQRPPDALRTAPLNEVWRWAKQHWNPTVLKGITQKPAPDASTPTQPTE
jgi:glutamyl-Q tRNA(Asp) synthetase